MAPVRGTSARLVHPSPQGLSEEVLLTEGSSHGAAFVAAKGIAVIIDYFGGSRTVIKSMLDSFLDFALNVDELEFVSAMKYFYAYPMSVLLKNDRPPQPKKVWAWTGVFAKWFWERIRAYSRQNLHFCFSVLMAKRCTAVVPDSFLRLCYEKHSKMMSAPFEKRREIVDEMLGMIDVEDACMRALAPVLARVRKAVDNGFPDFGKTTPSTSSCFEKPRSQGGQFGAILGCRDHCGILGDYVYEFRTILWAASAVTGDKVTCNVHTTVFSVPDVLFDLVHHKVRFLALQDGGRLLCKIHGVLEPLKVRIISKGPAGHYYACKPMQQLLWKTLKDMPCFRAIGRVLNVLDVSDVLSAGGDCKSNFSIDYAAATDGLSGTYTWKILSSICENLPFEMKNLYWRVLGNHSLRYPKYHSDLDVEMENGQLMGSILSFPILCLANLGVYLLVRCYNRETGVFQVSRLDDPSFLDWALNHVLINGDDMLYAADESLWEVQNHISTAVGLEPSIGKAYLHSKACTINSVAYEFDQQLENPIANRVDYLAVGLIENIRKVQGSTDDGTAEADPCPAVLNRILSSCSSVKKQHHVLKLYLRKYEAGKGRLNLRGTNLFIHPSFGGHGVQVPLGWKWSVTNDQMYTANVLKGDRSVDIRPHFGTIVTLERGDKDVIDPFNVSNIVFGESAVKPLSSYDDIAPEDVAAPVPAVLRMPSGYGLRRIPKRDLVRGCVFVRGR